MLDARDLDHHGIALKVYAEVVRLHACAPAAH